MINTTKNSRVIYSFCIPTYKKNKEVINAINSIYELYSLNDFEIIIVDNDQDNIYLDRYITDHNYDNLLYRKNKSNLGMVGNHNMCINLAKGKYIIFLHSDDTLDKNYFTYLTKIIEKYNPDIFFPSHVYMNDSYHAKKIENIKSTNKDIVYWMYYHKIKPFVTTSNIYGHLSGSCIKKEIYEQFRYFNENEYPSFDWTFCLKINKKNPILKSNKKLVYCWNLNNTSSTSETRKQLNQQRKDIINNAYRDEHNLFLRIYYKLSMFEILTNFFNIFLISYCYTKREK